MAQSGYTPILTYASGTATNVPLAANLTSSASGAELALNYADGKLFYKDSAGVVQVLASKAGNVNVASFQTSLGGLTPSTATTGVVTLAGTLNTTSGGTGLTSYTAGDLPYYATGTVLSKLAIGTSGQILTSSGTAPQWSTLSGVAVTTFSAGTTGFTPSSATSGAITLAGTLATTNGGTGLTSFTANGVVYASSTSALATGSALTFNGTTLFRGGADSAFAVVVSGVSKAVRFGMDSAGSYVEGVDNTGTGSYQPLFVGGSDLRFLVSGSEQMRLTSTGLGIGTSSPTTRLQVTTGATGVQGLFSHTSGTPTIAIGATATTYNTQIGYNVTSEYGYIQAVAAAGVYDDIAINPLGGNVGIGTSSPSAKLTVSGGQITITNSGAVNPAINFAGNGSGASGFQIGQNYNAQTLFVYDNAANAQRLTLDSSGNLGIGTSSPGAKLDVNGAAYIKAGNVLRLYRPDNGTYGDISHGASGTGLVYNDANGDSHVWQLSGTTAMLLNSSGNLGLGVTPSAWYANSKVFQFGNGGALEGRNNSALTAFSSNQYIDTSGNYKYIATDYATRYYQTSGQHIWQTAPSGTAGNAITFTQAMTLDASGRLGIGTSSPNAQLVVGGSGASGWVGGFRNTLQLRNSNSSGNQSNFLTFGSAGADSSCFILNDINADGTTVNQLNVQAGATGGVYLANGGSAWLVYSDERLKTALTPFKDALQKVCTLRTGTGRYLNDAETVSRSFLIAQDVQKVLPEAVDVQPNEQKTLGLSYTDLIPLLTAAIQEQQALIESLTTRLAALEAK